MELKEGIDYHITEVGKSLDLQSMTLAGFAAGIINLTRRSFKINLNTVTNSGMLMMAKTIPKAVKKKVIPKAKKVTSEKS